MMRGISIAVVAALAVILMAGGASAATGDGTGTMTVSPNTAVAGTTTNSFVFTFTSTYNFGSNSQATILIPSSWTTPQTTTTTSPGYVSITNINCSNPAPSLSVTGNTITITQKCQNGQEFNVTYGGTGATKVTAPTLASVYTFTTQTKNGGSGTLTNITTQPTVTVTAASANKLAFTVQPSTTTVGNAISPAVNVSIEDTFGNVNTSSTASVSIAISSGGTLSGTTNVSAVNGVASFSNLVPTVSGSYNLFANNSIGLANATSNSFTVNNPSPTTTSISPSSAAAGSSGFNMTVFGTNFITTSYVQLDGTNRTTTYVNSTALTASILASDMTSAGTHSIMVINPTPGGGTSNTQTFTVNSETIDVTLSNTPVNFSSVNAGSSNQPSLLPLNVTIQNTTNVNVNLTLNGSDFTYSTYRFGVGNLTYSNSSTGTKNSMTTSFPNPPYADWINITKLVTTNRSIYLWINIPPGQNPGTYSSTINVQAQKYV